MCKALWLTNLIIRLVDLLGEVEFKTKKLIDEKTNDFHAAYAALDRKAREYEQEVNKMLWRTPWFIAIQNNYLKTENQRLLTERKVDHQPNTTSQSEENKRLIDYYKEQLNQMAKTIEGLTLELKQTKSSTEKTVEVVHLNSSATRNTSNMTPSEPNQTVSEFPNSAQKRNGPIKVARKRKLSEDSYEMKLLELEGKLEKGAQNLNLICLF